jgi:Na+-driven multidrug efflux pump
MRSLELGRRLFKDEEELTLTSGSIGRSLFHLSLPIVIMNLFQTTYNLADTFWLGQYQTAALAATSFTFPMVLMYISIGLGISAGGSILVAQHLGADEPRLATRAASQTVTLSVVGALGLGALGYLFVNDVLAIIGAFPPGACPLDSVHADYLDRLGVHVRIRHVHGADAGGRRHGRADDRRRGVGRPESRS